MHEWLRVAEVYRVVLEVSSNCVGSEFEGTLAPGHGHDNDRSACNCEIAAIWKKDPKIGSRRKVKTRVRQTLDDEPHGWDKQRPLLTLEVFPSVRDISHLLAWHASLILHESDVFAPNLEQRLCSA
jgi:hypothetical protein